MFKNFPDVVDIKDLMKMLHIGRNLAYRLVADKVIPSRKVGRTYLISKIAVINYVLGG